LNPLLMFFMQGVCGFIGNTRRGASEVFDLFGNKD